MLESFKTAKKQAWRAEEYRSLLLKQYLNFLSAINFKHFGNIAEEEVKADALKP